MHGLFASFRHGRKQGAYCTDNDISVTIFSRDLYCGYFVVCLRPHRVSCHLNFCNALTAEYNGTGEKVASSIEFTCHAFHILVDPGHFPPDFRPWRSLRADPVNKYGVRI